LRKLGIIGGATWSSTALYYEQINRGVGQRLGGLHSARLLIESLDFEDYAAFHRSNDLVTQWGGPNQDNVYLHARIDPKRRYRIRGRMHACEKFVLTLRVDFMHMPEWGTLATITSSDRGVGPGDEFELLLGGDGSDPAWIPIPERVTTASLRQYYLDWQPREPAVFTIECLDDVEALYLEKLMATRDANEGLQAFIERRQPRWEHR
jgi:hypothetical protein